MSDDEKTVIICMRVGLEFNPIAGCIEETCRQCKTKVWLAPSGQRIKAQHDADVLCMECGAAMIEGEDDPDIQPPTSDQIQEVRNAILKEFL